MKQDLLKTIDDLCFQLGEKLRATGARVTTAESCTGGAIAASLTRISGASQWFDYGFVTYSNEAKTHMLGVPETLIEKHGAVSEEVVEAMVAQAAARAGAEFGVAVSGIAGPGGGTPDKPVGTVWLAWFTPHEIKSQKMVFEGDRNKIRMDTVHHGLVVLLECVEKYCIKKQ